MNWEPIAIYQMSNGKDKVNFQKNMDGRFLITDQKINKSWLASTKQARKIWKDYQDKGYTGDKKMNRLDLIKFIKNNSNLSMMLLSKKSIGWLRSMKTRIDAELRQNKFNKS